MVIQAGHGNFLYVEIFLSGRVDHLSPPEGSGLYDIYEFLFFSSSYSEPCLSFILCVLPVDPH